MGIRIRAALVCAMGLALVGATPAVFASTVPAHQQQTAHAVIKNGHLAIAIPLRPGSHAVSDAVLVSASTSLPRAAASSSPEIQVRVGPGTCAGYNGEIIYGFVGSGEDFVYIDTWGVLWDDCYNYYAYPSTAYVYVSYNELDEPRQNFQAGSEYDGGSAGASTGINTGPVMTADIFLPSDIVVTACLESIDGWQCGAGQEDE